MNRGWNRGWKMFCVLEKVPGDEFGDGTPMFWNLSDGTLVSSRLLVIL